MMRQIMLATLVTGAFMAAPASAQVYFGAGPGGVGAQVGPFGFGVGPRYDYYDGWRDNGWYGYRSYAYAPRYRMHRGWRAGPNAYERPSMRWDPYGKRWDGGN